MRPSLVRQCGEARADSNWYLMQDDAIRRQLAGEEAARMRFIEENCS
jgi:hypothetical protein